MSVRHSVAGCAAALVLVAACSRAPVGPPVEAALEGDSEAADEIRSLLDVARRQPRSAEARGRLAMAYDVNSQFHAARESYRQATELDPNDARWPYLAALLDARTGELSEAMTGIDRALRLSPDYASAHLYHGNWLLDLGRAADALAAFERAARLDPASIPAAVGVARARLELGQSAEALAVLEPLAARAPSDAYVQQWLGKALRRAGKLEAAAAAVARGRGGRSPNWSDPWSEARQEFRRGFGADMIRAEDMARSGRFVEALELLERLRTQHPTDRALLSNLSVVYRNLGRVEEAFETLGAGLEAHPDYFPFHLNISADYERKGDLERALFHLDRAIEIKPELAAAHQSKGAMLLRARRLEPALAAFDEALRYGGDDVMSLVSSGILLAELERWEAAAERLERAVAVAPNHVVALFSLAMVRAELGDAQGASQALERSAALAPNDPRIERARARIASTLAGRR